jgi:hypothetical protein
MSDSRFLTAYVDLPFIEKLWASKPDLVADPYDERPDIWRSVCGFLQRNARIVVDVDRETLEARPRLQAFLFDTGQVRHVRLNPDVTQNLSRVDQLREENPYTLFLFESPDIPVHDLREQTGLLFLRYDDLERDWLRLFRHHNIDIGAESGEAFEWGCLQRHGSPLNSIIVADKYAYNQFVNNTFEENLGALLLALLPDRINSTSHITLVTDLWTAYQEKRLKPNEIYDRIEDHIATHRTDLEVSLTVSSYGSGAGHKDRFIITNYALFASNDSFEFFRDGALRKETFVHHLPLSENGSKVKRRLKRLAEINSSPPEYPRPNQRGLLLGSGSGENRLLDTAILST